MNPLTYAPWFLLLSLSIDAGAPCVIRASEEKPDAASTLRKLTTGSIAERIGAAEEAGDLFARLSDDPSGLSEEELVTRLIDAMDLETDDWVTRTMLESLMGDWDTELTRLFRAALDSPSPNVRAMAVRWYARWNGFNEMEDAVEPLEGLWEDGVPSWARLDLMEALITNGSVRFVEDFIRLARDSDLALRIHFIEALGGLSEQSSGEEDVLAALVAFSREKDPLIASTALETLARFHESVTALDAVLAGTRSLPPVQRSAVEALASFSQVQSSDRLIELLEDPGASAVHEAAAESLVDSDNDRATAALVVRLQTAFARGETELAATLVQVLHRRNDPDALPGLRAIEPVGVEPAEQDGPGQGLRDLIAYLDPDGEPTRSRTLSANVVCDLPAIEPLDPAMRRIVPPPGRRTVRCWERPGVAGESWDSGRIPRGALFVPDDYFDRNGETWVLDTEEIDDCWVPESLTGPASGPGAPARGSSPEVDVPPAALRTSLSRRLIDSGAIVPFDEEDDVVGVVIRIGPKDPRFLRWSDEMLDLDVDVEDEMETQEDPESR